MVGQTTVCKQVYELYEILNFELKGTKSVLLFAFRSCMKLLHFFL